jgi:hypothetical protein
MAPQFIGPEGGGPWIWDGALAAGERGEHWWLYRGVHRCNSSKIVIMSVPRLLPRSNEPRRGVTEVTGVSTATPAVRPRRTATGTVVSFCREPIRVPTRSFYLPVNIHCVPSTNHGDRRESRRNVSGGEGDWILRSFCGTVPLEPHSVSLIGSFVGH